MFFYSDLNNDFNSGFKIEWTCASENVGMQIAEIKNDIVIYPNPATDYIVVENLSPQYNNLEIRDVLGRIILQQTTKGQSTQINLNHLNGNGIYLVHLLDENGQSVSVKKLMIY